MSSIILFEDEQVHWLYPATIGRPAFQISCGSYRLWELMERLGAALYCVVRPHLVDVQQANYPRPNWPAGGPAGPVLLVNGSMVPSVAVAARLRTLLKSGEPGIVRSRGRVAAAVLPANYPAWPERLTVEQLADYLSRLSLRPIDLDLPLLEYPHEIVRYHQLILRENLDDRLAQGGYQQVADGLFVADGVKLGQFLVTDTRHGPIVIEQGASVGPFCYLSGPAHLGAFARVIEHAAIKDAVAIGHTTKIGGEVEASIVEPYTNKQHHGFLGHSYLGSWINLGAGTCNSDLKNTYGTVNMEYHGRKVATGMQFVGCVMGDYAKTAINTGIFTGKTIGACSMLYGFVTTNVPSYVNYARSFGQVTELPVDVMSASQARMFARRNVTQRPCDVQLLHAMYDLTQHERQITGEPLAF